MGNWNNAMSADEARKAMLKDRDILPTHDQLDSVEGFDSHWTAHTGQASFQDELKRVNALYGDAVNYARSFMDDVRNDKPIDFSEAAPLIDEFIDSIFRNDSAAAAISKLKNFDEYTYTHSINVSVLAVLLGKRLGYNRERLQLAGMAGMFHDVGKAVIPPEILNKPGKLTDNEMNIMRTHPLHSYTILSKSQDMPADIIAGALEHHEKYDGSGYPRGLKGDEITEIARLLAVVDVYDALTSKRCYKDPMPPGKVLAMMYQWRVTDYHPDTVEQFIKSLGVYPVGSLVKLSTNQHGVVVDHQPTDPLNPSVKVCFDASFSIIPPTIINLAETAHLSVIDVLNPETCGVDIFTLVK